MAITMKQRGYTLLELAFILAILGVLTAVALPNMHRLVERQHAQAAADALTQDLRNARELAVQGGVPVHVSFGGDAAAGHWCWGVSRGAACDCGAGAVANACNISRTDSSSFAKVRLERSASADFQSLGQNLKPGGTVFGTAAGDRYWVRMSLAGNARNCREGSKNC